MLTAEIERTTLCSVVQRPKDSVRTNKDLEVKTVIGKWKENLKDPLWAANEIVLKVEQVTNNY